MEITGIDTLHAIKTSRTKETAPNFDDTLTISSEAKKRAEWLEKVKLMPDIRSDKLNPSSEISSHHILAVAHSLINSGF